MNPATRPQSTLRNSATVSGFGFWSGEDVAIEFRPADENTGVVFVRSDLPGQPRIAATLENRIASPRRTTLQQHGHVVEMVEHVMAALAGLQIDNCEVHVNRAEMPGMDGSSEPFVAALLEAGQTWQLALRQTLQVHVPLRVESGKAWIQAVPASYRSPLKEFQLTYRLSYPHASAIEDQAFSSVIDPDTFVQEIAPARTFLLTSEAEQLHQQGLGRRVSFQDVLVFDSQGPINNSLRFADECARHKTLDMIGDFALVGADLVGRFTASRSGHLLNAQIMQALMQQTVITQFKRLSA